MQSSKIVYCFIAALAISSAASINELKFKASLEASDLQFLGEHASKLYFTNTSQSLVFHDALMFCQSRNMHSATFVNGAEFEEVNKFLPSERFWTSAVNTNVFRWNDGEGQVVDSSFDISIPSYYDTTCIFALWGTFFIDSCVGETGKYYYPLCQMHVN